MLRFGSMERNEKDSRDEPKELWIHGLVCLWAMDMSQSKLNENQYFKGTEGGDSGKSTQGSIRFDLSSARHVFG
jgi:hypothetical protein